MNSNIIAIGYASYDRNDNIGIFPKIIGQLTSTSSFLGNDQYYMVNYHVDGNILRTKIGEHHYNIAVDLGQVYSKDDRTAPTPNSAVSLRLKI